MGATEERQQLFLAAFKGRYGYDPEDLVGKKIKIVKEDDGSKQSRDDIVEDRFFCWCGAVAEVLVTTLVAVIVPTSQQYVYAFAVSGDFDYSAGSVSLSFHVRQNKGPVGYISNIQLGSKLIVLA